MRARTILALSVPVAFVGFVVMAINSEDLSEADLAAVSALLGAIVNGTYNSVKDQEHEGAAIYGMRRHPAPSHHGTLGKTFGTGPLVIYCFLIFTVALSPRSTQGVEEVTCTL
jgi:hypothetical protein